MINNITKEAKERMIRSIDALKTAFAKIRTGRAHPSLLEHIKVSYYNNETPLNQVANISIENSRTLLVTPWEKNMVQPVEKAIRESDLGLNPASAGQTIRVPLPALTEQRRKELIRVVRDEAEQGKVAIRNIRRDANQSCKDLLKRKEISEDDERRAEANIQKLTDQYINEADKLLEKKEAEMMEV